jgi:hypothetical protein
VRERIAAGRREGVDYFSTKVNLSSPTQNALCKKYEELKELCIPQHQHQRSLISPNLKLLQLLKK